MMKTLADGLAALQDTVREVHASGRPERRRMLGGTVELFRVNVYGPVDCTTSLVMPLGQIQVNARRYSETHQSESLVRDACVASIEAALYRLAVASEHAKLDPGRAIVRPDFDTSPAPNLIAAP